MNDFRDARRAAASAGTLDAFNGQARQRGFATQLRMAEKTVDGKSFVSLRGHATIVDTPYQMYDMFGPYDEVVAHQSFDRTLAAEPDVAFLVNHTGLTMARTASGTLRLSMDDEGLLTESDLNPQRSDVQDLRHAIEDGDVDQMSFAFRIVEGRWNDNFDQYTITEVDLDRGDVSAVNYGANPYTSIGMRSQRAFEAVRGVEGPALRALAEQLLSRLDPEPENTHSNQSKGTLLARLELE